MKRLQYEVVVRDLLTSTGSSLLGLLSGGQRIGRPLAVQLALVDSRVADLFFELGRTGLLHIEVQSSNHRKMPHRMVVYGVLGALKHGRSHVVQVVLYIGKPRMNMPCKLDLGGIQCEYRQIDIREFEAEALLATGNPADFVLAMLARGGADRLREIVSRAARLDGVERQRVLAQLTVLAGLRGTAERLKIEFEEAGVRVNIEDNVLLREIRDTGFAMGLAMGEAKGEARGLAKGEASLLVRLLESKFGELPRWAELRLGKATRDQIERWGQSLLTASTLEGAIGRR